MAENTIKYITYSRSGDSSPQGSVTGVKGELFKDTVTNNVYESLGGTDWRLIVKDGVPLIARTHNTWDEFKAIDDTVDGEIHYVVERGAYYKITEDVGTYIKLGPVTGNIVKSIVGQKSGGNFGVDDTMEVRCTMNLDSAAGSNGVYDFGFGNSGQFDGTFGLREIAGDKFAVSTLRSTDIQILSVKNDLGTPVSSSNIRKGDWVTISVRMKTASAGSYIRIGSYQYLNSSISVSHVVVNGERFDMNEGSGTTVTGDEGTVLTFGLGLKTWVEIIPDEYLTYNINGKLAEIKPIDPILTPQMLGYNTLLNGSGVDNSNYASDIINAIEQSPYALRVPNGVYNLDKPIELYNPQSHYWGSGGIDFNADIFKSGKTSRVHFYSYSKIPYFLIRTGGVNIEGGYYDTSHIPWGYEYANLASFPAEGVDNVVYKATDTGLYYDWDGSAYQTDTEKTIQLRNTEAVIRLCYRDDNILSGNYLRLHFYGNRDAVRRSYCGYHGILIDSTTQNPFGGSNPDSAEIHWTNYDLYGEYMASCLLASSDPLINPNSPSSNSMHDKIRFKAWKCKAGVILDGMFQLSNIEGQCQGDYLITADERTDSDTARYNTFIYVNSSRCEITFQTVDMDNGIPDGSGLYRQSYGLVNSAVNNVVTGNMVFEKQKILEIIPLETNRILEFNPNFAYTRGTRELEDGTFIFDIDNYYANAIKKGITVTAVSYENIDGAFSFGNLLPCAGNYDAAGSGLVSENSNVIIDNKDYVFTPYDQSGAVLNYGAGFDRDENDFVEFVIDNLPVTKLSRIGFSLDNIFNAERMQPNQIDIIVNSASDGRKRKSYSNFADTQNNIAYILEGLTYDQIIIRLIGSSSSSPSGKDVQISSFYAKAHTYGPNQSNSINTYGGQTIYGNLNVNEIKESKTALTGATLDLSSTTSKYYNMASPSAATTYTVTGQVVGGSAVTKINTTSQPTVTGGTLLASSPAWVTGTDMKMMVTYDGSTLEYFFIEL